MAAPPCSQLQSMLQSAVQSVQWTYSLFWQISTEQGMLVWADGYYNGAIKTRKTVEPMELSTEEASLQRSQQLRDLYESLSAGETNQPVRRPCAALSPEDLTESEWFYLMCISFSFPPGVGLPGKAFARKQHVWITGANEIDSRTFSRAILAKSARIKTVVCIPLMEGVVELGTTDKVKEDIGFIQRIKSIFTEPHSRPPKPALSELSTSNSATSFEYCENLYSSTVPAIYDASQLPADQQEEDDNDSAAESDFETETSHGGCPSSVAMTAAAAAGEPSELMQLRLSEDLRLGSPDDGSNNLGADFHLLTMPQSGNSEDIQLLPDSYKNESGRRWSIVQEQSNSELQPPPLETPPAAGFTDEDAHYSSTVSTILQNQYQSHRWSASSSVGSVICSPQSAFSKWAGRSDLQRSPIEGTSSSQWLLKHILHNVPFLHTKHRDETSLKSRDGRWQKGAPQDELSANHVLAERRRREKLNEKFVILRSIVPFVTKMDKASILGDTIEYVKQLHKKIQDLEVHNRKMENERTSSLKELRRIAAAYRTHYDQPGSNKRKLRILESVGGKGIKHKALNSPPRPPSPTSADTNLQVSIIETDGLLELQCPYKEGLLLNIMQILQELRIETTAVQSSLNNGVFVAELRAKVKENMNGKKASIMEVKRAIQQIIPHIDT